MAFIRFSSFLGLLQCDMYRTNCIFFLYFLGYNSCSSHAKLTCIHQKDAPPHQGCSWICPKSKKKKSEGATAELIDILKPGNDENIELGDSIPVGKLDKINSPQRSKFIPSSDTQGWTVQDEETRVTAEALQILNKQQPGAGHHLCSMQSTPPGEAE